MSTQPDDLMSLISAARAEEFDIYTEAVNPQLVRLLRTIGFDVHWERAEGQYMYASDGRGYLDMLSGYGMNNVGRNNPRVIETLRQVLSSGLPDVVQLGINTIAAVLARRLLEVAPESMGRVFFTNSGSESVETAIKVGRAATGRSKVLSTYNGFHGLTLGSLSANGNPEFVEAFEPLVPGFEKVPFDDLQALEEKLRSEEFALFLVEPVQGKGVTVPSQSYLKQAESLCRRFGTLLCVDEVQTGLGRTGRMFACQHWDVQPDVITVAKSLSGGFVPIGACMFRTEVFDEVFDSIENAFAHSTTFQPNDLAAAAGLATLDVLQAESLPERSAELGAVLLEATTEVAGRHDLAREARGLGLMWALEFEPPAGQKVTYRLGEKLHEGMFAQLVAMELFREHGVLIEAAGHDINALKALPSLVIEEGDINRFVEALDNAIGSAGDSIVGGLVSLGARAGRTLT